MVTLQLSGGFVMKIATNDSELETLTIQHLVLRDIVVRMLSYQAIVWADPKAFITNFSDAGIRRAYMVVRDGCTNEECAAIAATEIDWITNAALAMVNGAIAS
jgi:hypothetical protein